MDNYSVLRIGETDFRIGKRTYIMGILNVTPDSFSDGGRYDRIETASARASSMEEEGADLIDIGGESTRPGHTPVDNETEIRRVVPVIEAVRKQVAVPLSVDTSKAKVAQAALEAGADLVNDVWGGRKDPDILEVIARNNAACCLMHNKEEAEYENLIEEVLDVLKKNMENASKAGVAEDKILLDPGIGFGKTVGDNFEVMRNLSRFQKLGYPLLLGASRKSLIGKTLELPVDQRIEGTIATTVMAIEAGFSFIRVHDVKENLRAARIGDIVYRGGE